MKINRNNIPDCGVYVSNIGNYTLENLTQQLHSCHPNVIKISKRKIQNLELEDLLFLIRRNSYLELSVLLVSLYFQNNKFSAYAFNHDDRSIAEHDILKEIILLNSTFWQYNQFAFSVLMPIIKEYAPHIHLKPSLINEFISIQISAIVIDEEFIERINTQINMDHTSSVLSAQAEIRQIQRAINEGIEVQFKIGIEEKLINSKHDMIEYVLAYFAHSEIFLENLDKEIKIII